MLDALYAAATGMMAKQEKLTVISNNMANVDTVAFKKSRGEFEDLMYRNLKDPGSATSATTMNPTGVQLGTGVKLAATTREHSQGSMKGTERDLDVAIAGDGFFAIQKPNGEIAYSRDGGFRLDAEGKLVTTQGFSLVPEIAFPPGSRGVTITPDGRVSCFTGNANEKVDVGQIQLTTFANPSGLQSEGGNLYTVSPSSGNPTVLTPGDSGSGQLNQKFLEASNVSPVEEMMNMISTQRGFELDSKGAQAASEMLNTVNQLK